MKPSPISVAMLVVSLFLAPALLAQSPASANQSAASPAPAASNAEVPRLIKFSGTLLDAQDRPMAGPVGVTFALHAQQTGGAALWMETQNVTPDARGLYNVLLGANSANGVPAELFASGEARWLEVQVERQAEQPRVLLVSVPYALKAKDAETLGGKPASAYALATPEITSGTGNGRTGGSGTGVGTQAGTGAKATKSTQSAAAAVTGTTGHIAVFTDNAGSLGNSLLVQSGNSMGLGQAAGSNPTIQFDVNGGIRGTGLATGGRNVASDAINTNALLLNGSNAMGVIGTNNAAFAPGALFTKTSFYSGAVERMTIDGTTGNVGIGTTAPAAKLDVAGNLNLPATTTGGTMGVISLGGTRFAHNFGPANAGNTFIGVGAGNFTMTGGRNTAVGASTLTSNTTGSGNDAFGFNALGTNTTGFDNDAFGFNALGTNTTGIDNSAFGSGALSFNTMGNYNSAFGYNALISNATAAGNTAFGANALLFDETGAGNTAVGMGALQSIANGDYNIAIGANAGSLATGSNNIYIGNFGVFGESNIIRIGDPLTHKATFLAGTIMGNLSGNAATATNFSGNLTGEVTGTQNATVVSDAVVSNTANTIVRRDVSGSFAAGTIALSGNLALPNTTSASVGVITLGGAPFLHNFGPGNTFVGASAGNMTMTAGGNTGVGSAALGSDTTGLLNSAFGHFALTANTTGGVNNAFGAFALTANTTGGVNNAFGYAALYSNTTGGDNNAFGYAALYSNTAGGDNNAFGSGALGSNTAGQFNSAFGEAALSANTTGDQNNAFGFAALGSNTTGTNNLAIGYGAGSNLTTGRNNIYIGSAAATSSESSTIRIGSGNQTAAFMAGISGATSASGTAVLVNSNGQLGTLLSSRRFKDEIADMAGESDLLMKLRPVSFYYKPEYDETHTRQYGLVAEEVAQVSPELVVFDKDGVPQTVRYHFVNAMLLNEVQKQQNTIAQQQAEIQDLAARLAKLEALVSPAP
jgi:hypothetical protein